MEALTSFNHKEQPLICGCSFPSYLTNRRFSDMVSLPSVEIMRERGIAVGLYEFLSSYWLWTIVSLFVAKWLFSLASRKKYLSDRERSVDAKDADLKKKESSLDSAFEGRERALEDRRSRIEESLRIRSRNLDSREQRINDQVRARAVETVRDIANRPYLSNTPAFSSLHGVPFPYERLTSALTQEMRIESPFNISASIHSSSGETYRTTLYECDCPDFRNRRQACKHMIRLALEAGLLLSADSSAAQRDIVGLSFQRDRLKSECEVLDGAVKHAREVRASEIEKTQDAQQKIVEEARSRCLEYENQMRRAERRLSEKNEALNRIYAERVQSQPWLASYYADLYQSFDEKWVLHLRNKNRPAGQKAGEVDKLIHGELREWRLRAKRSEYQLNFYESLFPWLLDFKEVPPMDAFKYVSDDPSDDDERAVMRDYLSPTEWSDLPTAEKYQLALDRYIRRSKTNWEVGIEYERYIGYLCESRGYHVRYYGATMKKEDMGRDLILQHGKKVILIQCKRWAKEKVIHENHVFQLAGSVFEYQYSHPDTDVIGAFVATNGFSPVAKLCAERLGIKLYPNIPFAEYPRIKCNIGRDGQKIFHLPMDQQYDNVQICDDGERYVSTVNEALSLGFRRAYRWRGSSPE